MTDRTTPQEASRAAFEAWAKLPEIQLPLARSTEHYSYTTYAAGWAWSAWKARDAEIQALRDALQEIAAMTDAADEHNFRADDREGCLDAAYAISVYALAATKEQA